MKLVKIFSLKIQFGHLSAKCKTNQQIQFYPVPIILEDIHHFLSLRFAFGAGASPLLWVFMGEIIPPDYKVGSLLFLTVQYQQYHDIKRGALQYS